MKESLVTRRFPDVVNNSNSNYSSDHLLEVLQKWDELVEIRSAVVELFGEEKHHKLLSAIRAESELRKETRCPPRLLLDLTPSKQQRVVETWDSIVRSMRKTYDERNFLYELNKVKQMRSLDEIDDYLDKRKNRDQNLVEENKPARRFNNPG